MNTVTLTRSEWEWIEFLVTEDAHAGGLLSKALLPQILDQLDRQEY